MYADEGSGSGKLLVVHTNLQLIITFGSNDSKILQTANVPCFYNQSGCHG